jgi:dihydrodipicolinate synthase/N-acetylneuraminate lyase
MRLMAGLAADAGRITANSGAQLRMDQSHGAAGIHAVVVLGESGKVPRTGHAEEAQVAISSQPRGCLRRAN